MNERSATARRRRTRVGLILPSLLMLVAGCATPDEKLATYPFVDERQSLDLMRQRSADLTSVTGQGSVGLKSPTRGAVTLESAFVLRSPGDARVRAWKFNQAVFDLTVKPEGVWVYSPREKTAPNAGPGEITKAGSGLTEPVRQWIALLMGDLQSGGATAVAQRDAITLTRKTDDGATLTTHIDRPTLTIRSQTLVDAAGVERFRLTFGKYRHFGVTLWPSQIVAKSATGTITINTDKLTTNDALDTAFTPPRRATKLQ